MSIRFDGRVAIVTGAAAGLGRSHARELAARGAKVVVNDFGGDVHGTGGSSAPAERVAEEIRQAGGEAISHGASVTSAEQVAHMVEATLARWGRIDILINNAGITGNRFQQVPGKFDYAEFRQVFETNVVAPLKIADTFLPQVQASRLKKIVVISSSEGSIAGVKRPGGYFYRSSKSAVNMVMRNLALELKPRGITVVIVNPGPVDTDMMKGAPIPLQSPAEAAGRVIAVTTKATLEDTGKFWDHLGGELPW